MKDSMTYQATLEDGRIEEAQRVILQLGTKKFGPPAEAARAMVTAILDRERRERIGDAAASLGRVTRDSTHTSAQ